MAAYIAGDAGAFRALFDRYAPQLYRLVRRRVGSDDDARDLVQQTLLQMHRARNDFRADSRVRPWLFTIAVNLVREHYRKRGRRPEHALESDAPLAADSSTQPGAQDESHERSAQVRAALSQLPAQQREVIELHWFEHSPYEEIAAIVGASVAAVRVRAHRGYLKLRELLPGVEHE